MNTVPPSPITKNRRASRRSSTGDMVIPLGLHLSLTAEAAEADKSCLLKTETNAVRRRQRHNTVDLMLQKNAEQQEVIEAMKAKEARKGSSSKLSSSNGRHPRRQRRASLGGSMPEANSSNHSASGAMNDNSKSNHSSSRRRRSAVRRTRTSSSRDDDGMDISNSNHSLTRATRGPPLMRSSTVGLENNGSNHSASKPSRPGLRRSSTSNGNFSSSSIKDSPGLRRQTSKESPSLRRQTSKDSPAGVGRQRRRISLQSRQEGPLLMRKDSNSNNNPVSRSSSSSSHETAEAADPCEDNEFGFALHGFLLDLPDLVKAPEEQQESGAKPKRRVKRPSSRVVPNSKPVLHSGLQF